MGALQDELDYHCDRTNRWTEAACFGETEWKVGPWPLGQLDRYHAWAFMIKYIAVAAVMLCLAGCRDSKPRYKQPIASKGEFLVAQEDLPSEILELARALERLPTISSDAEFRSMLTSCGLDKEPDHYKDGVHVWYLDEEFISETDPQKRTYRISIGHFPTSKSRIMFYAASIESVFPADPWRETLWQIDWPFESSD